MPHLNVKTAAVALLLLVSGGMAGQVPQPSEQFPDIPKNLRQYFIALYVKGAKADQPQTQEERTAFMQQHTAYLRSQVEAGKYLLVGPFLDGGQIRGMAVIHAASAEEARAIAESTTLQIASVRAPRALASLSAAKVSAVSPLWEIATTRSSFLTTGSR